MKTPNLHSRRTPNPRFRGKAHWPFNYSLGHISLDTSKHLEAPQASAALPVQQTVFEEGYEGTGARRRISPETEKPLPLREV